MTRPLRCNQMWLVRVLLHVHDFLSSGYNLSLPASQVHRCRAAVTHPSARPQHEHEAHVGGARVWTEGHGGNCSSQCLPSEQAHCFHSALHTQQELLQARLPLSSPVRHAPQHGMHTAAGIPDVNPALQAEQRSESTGCSTACSHISSCAPFVSGRTGTPHGTLPSP